MERAKSIVHLSCDPLVLSNVLREATHLERALLYLGALIKWNFDQMRVSNPAAEMSSGFLGFDERPATFFYGEQKARGIAGWTNVNECKLRCPNTIGADHTRCYRGSKRGQAMTIERLSLNISSHTGREVQWQGHTPVWLLAEYSSHPNIIETYNMCSNRINVLCRSTRVRMGMAMT